jgi:GNAT superfamily N-acetyltransferase
MQHPVTRVADALRRHGPLEFTRLALDRLKPAPRWANEWIWYQVDLHSPERPRRQLGEGLELRRGGPQDLPLLGQLPANPWVTPMSEHRAARRLADGGTLWLVFERDRLAFVSWVFRRHLPVYGARGGKLELPAGVACVDDSICLPGFRGRGIAPAFWSTIAEVLAQDGERALLRRVHVTNTSSRRAGEKLGFREVARMQVVERDWRKRIRVAFPDDNPEHRWLASLTRG